MNYKFLIFTMALFLATNIANAKVTPLNEWEGNNPDRITTLNSEPTETSCSELCVGYSISVNYCSEDSGQILEDCPQSGCHYYHRCVDEN